MPKKTYFNLNTDKKEKIEKALLNEFSRVPFSEVAISNIIEEAQIPRGSFYQYFENKEDAITYIIQKYIKLEKETIKVLLKECNGNIFNTCIKIFDYTIQKISVVPNMKLYKNIFDEIKKNNINMFEEKDEIEEIEKLIDFNVLKVNKQEDLKIIIKMLINITILQCMEVICKKTIVENAKKELEKQLEFFKNGVAK